VFSLSASENLYLRSRYTKLINKLQGVLTMNVYDVIVESKKVDEGPLDYVKRAMGSKAAATKIDIDKDAKRLTKDFMAFVKNTPDGKPNTQMLFQFLRDAGLPVGSEKEIISAIRKNPSMSRKLSGLANKAGQGLKKAGKAVGSAGQAIAKKAKGAAPLQKKQADDGQMELPFESIMEAALQPNDIQGIIKHFVQKGLQTTGAQVQKSKYAVDQGQMPKTAPRKAVAKSKVSGSNPQQLEKMADTLRQAGYKVIAPKN